jgi:hypothetical protein
MQTYIFSTEEKNSTGDTRKCDSALLFAYHCVRVGVTTVSMSNRNTDNILYARSSERGQSNLKTALF